MSTNISIQNRIVLIDAIRGYALMGLFLIHMVEYYELYWYKPVPDPINTWMFNLFGGKAYAIFALLFGLSFYIILQRNADRGTDFRWRFVWRITLLFAMGYLHTLIYSGEILQLLAVAGLLLVPLWRAPSWLVLSLSAFFLLQCTAYIFIFAFDHSQFAHCQNALSEYRGKVFESYAYGNLVGVLRANAWMGNIGKWDFMLESGRVANILGLSILGLWLGRSGFFINVARYGRWYLPLLVISIVGAIVAKYCTGLFLAIPHPELVNGMWSNIIKTYFNLMLTFTSVLTFVVLYRSALLQRVLSLLAAPGRMTLSFYVGQSVFCVPLFYNFGLGLYAGIGQFWSLMLGLLLWVLQVAFANWWIKRFHYGPLEWCWRAATYLSAGIPFRRKVAIASTRQ